MPTSTTDLDALVAQAATILDKIDNCHIFVGDISIVQTGKRRILKPSVQSHAEDRTGAAFQQEKGIVVEINRIGDVDIDRRQAQRGR